mmetsp:Transcript_8568/g.20830  ORF Transcript_8568/g.20830 Transcript_8568/m.20830 type:complete len:316 (-) Transcript_8568:4399-5346(-)
MLPPPRSKLGPTVTARAGRFAVAGLHNVVARPFGSTTLMLAPERGGCSSGWDCCAPGTIPIALWRRSVRFLGRACSRFFKASISFTSCARPELFCKARPEEHGAEGGASRGPIEATSPTLRGSSRSACDAHKSQKRPRHRPASFSTGRIPVVRRHLICLVRNESRKGCLANSSKENGSRSTGFPMACIRTWALAVKLSPVGARACSQAAQVAGAGGPVCSCSSSEVENPCPMSLSRLLLSPCGPLEDEEVAPVTISGLMGRVQDGSRRRTEGRMLSHARLCAWWWSSFSLLLPDEPPNSDCPAEPAAAPPWRWLR